MHFKLGYIFLISCVSTSAAPNLEIIGGEPANIKDYPYMVHLRDNYDEFVCAGSILDEYTILTAAHCVITSEPPDVFHILYGNTNINLGNRIQVAKMIGHKDFIYEPPWTYDIAIIKLSNPILFGETAQPVKLPKPHESTPANKIAKLAGWGVIDISLVIYPENLQAVNLTIFTDKECVDSIHVLNEGDVNPETELCAGDRDGGKGQCHGDSGGALVIDGVQYGIVSYGKGCAEKGFPGVLTKVSGYFDWIKEHRRG